MEILASNAAGTPCNSNSHVCVKPFSLKAILHLMSFTSKTSKFGFIIPFYGRVPSSDWLLLAVLLPVKPASPHFTQLSILNIWPVRFAFAHFTSSICIWLIWCTSSPVLPWALFLPNMNSTTIAAPRSPQNMRFSPVILECFLLRPGESCVSESPFIPPLYDMPAPRLTIYSTGACLRTQRNGGLSSLLYMRHTLQVHVCEHGGMAS